MDSVRADLLADLRLTLDEEGHVPMYDFAWTLRGYDIGLTPDQIKAISHDVYQELIDRVPLRLVWNFWPKDLEGSWPADPATPLDFDLAPDHSTTQPYLLLVPGGAVTS